MVNYCLETNIHTPLRIKIVLSNLCSRTQSNLGLRQREFLPDGGRHVRRHLGFQTSRRFWLLPDPDHDVNTLLRIHWVGRDPLLLQTLGCDWMRHVQVFLFFRKRSRGQPVWGNIVKSFFHNSFREHFPL